MTIKYGDRVVVTRDHDYGSDDLLGIVCGVAYFGPDEKRLIGVDEFGWSPDPGHVRYFGEEELVPLAENNAEVMCPWCTAWVGHTEECALASAGSVT